MRRNFSLFSRYSLKLSRYLLLFGKPLITRFKIRSLLVAEVARCKISLFTRSKIRSLLVAKLLIAKNLSLLLAKLACYSV